MINNDLGILPAAQWRSPLDVSCLPTSASTASHGAVTLRATGTRVAAAHAVPRLRVTVPASVAVTAPLALAAKRFGQPGIDQMTNHKYMTGANATGTGASGPPRKREPA
jgi:hypothetical protein